MIPVFNSKVLPLVNIQDGLYKIFRILIYIRKMEKQKIAIIALSVALVLLFQYLLLDEFLEEKQLEMFQVFQEGYEAGLTDAVTMIFEQTQNCQPTSIRVENTTKQIFDLSCLERNLENTP